MTEALKTTIEAYKDALTSSSNLQAWALAAYGQACKVYVNIDVRNPPADTDCPYILLRPVACRYGRGVSEKVSDIEMMCVLHDESYRQDPETNAIEYTGVQYVMDMLDYAVAAIAAVDTGNALLNDITAEFETIEFFPFFMAGVPLTLREPITLGATRTTL